MPLLYRGSDSRAFDGRPRFRAEVSSTMPGFRALPLRQPGIPVKLRCPVHQPPSLMRLAPLVVIHPRNRQARCNLSDTLVSYENHCSCQG